MVAWTLGPRALRPIRTQSEDMYRIVRPEVLNPATFLWDVEAPDVAASARPGQFVMVRLHDGSERVPLTIADFDSAAGTVTGVVQALGRSTIEMRDRYAEGDSRADFVGPRGRPPPAARVGDGGRVEHDGHPDSGAIDDGVSEREESE